MRLAGWIAGAALGLVLAGSTAAANALLEEGDRAWSQRSRVATETAANPAEVERAIAAYGQAISASPEAVAPRWKQLRALHFLVDFSSADEARKQEAVEQAVELAAASLDRFEDATAPRDELAQLHFWAAIAWGVRGQRAGLLTIVREGVANRMHEHAQRAAALDASVERGGAYRLLSRLHADLPRVPFISSWVDRDKSVPLAEQGFAIDPDDPGNQLILAMALLERVPERRGEALALLARVRGLEPRPELLSEDRAIRERAEELSEKVVAEAPDA